MFLSVISSAKTTAADKGQLSFSRDVRPILTNHCSKCHGPDDKQRSANLRLDTESGAYAALRGGHAAIVPHKPETSELVRRIYANGLRQMPPLTSNKPLSAEKKEILTRWIKQGARYEAHWSFIKPVKARIPKLGYVSPIDNFTRDNQARAFLGHAPQADKATLLRRVSLDLTGLPPSYERVIAFLQDKRPGAYERAVDTLLNAPQYGERWARKWMDLARYADTNGYEKDRPRSLWPWRDYIISAFNTDVPFNQFTVEQLAGDMIRGATTKQRVATGFHRNTMLNEEGGIDPNEYRFLSVVDRVATTGITWLGLTIGCAQCHTHKFDPITQTDYYRTFAFLNNADEPDFDILTQKQQADFETNRKIATERKEAILSQWRVQTVWKTNPTTLQTAPTAQHAKLSVNADKTISASGERSATDTYTLAPLLPVGALGIRITAKVDGATGPGRTNHGNFVISSITASQNNQRLKFRYATASINQAGFTADNVLDKDTSSGWAIANSNSDWRKDQFIDLILESPIRNTSPITLVIDQQYGHDHTLARFQVDALFASTQQQPVGTDAGKLFAQWTNHVTENLPRFTRLNPKQVSTNMPTLTHMGDGVIVASGDQSKSDTYTVTYPINGKKIASLRLETMTDPSLPNNGPGRTAYEGPVGDFALSEIKVDVDGKPVTLLGKTKVYPSGSNPSDALDGDLLTAWSVNGNIGKDNTAWFELQTPITGSTMTITMVCERYYASGVGKFRWASANTASLDFQLVDAKIHDALLRNDVNPDVLFAFAKTRPELTQAVQEINTLEARPSGDKTLVMKERSPGAMRTTHLYKRGEFLQPSEAVTPSIPSIFRPTTRANPQNRLEYAKWLVSTENPLTSRVYVNRQWHAFFGRGIVKTLDDFGTQGDQPTNQALLDWLAVDFMEKGWSTKKLHRTIVLSETYKQSASVSIASRRQDPDNIHLTRGPRVRLDAEQIRDNILAAAGQLSRKIGGPSVFPPQPASITTEGSYGALSWNVSTGEDRYRRSIYTFSKRTAPFAMSMTFDGSSGEACIAKRDVSTTPLQALTLLNDTLVLEASAALAKVLIALPERKRPDTLILRTVNRPIRSSERIAMELLIDDQISKGTSLETAWMLLSRAALNTDEMVTKP